MWSLEEAIKKYQREHGPKIAIVAQKPAVVIVVANLTKSAPSPAPDDLVPARRGVFVKETMKIVGIWLEKMGAD